MNPLSRSSAPAWSHPLSCSIIFIGGKAHPATSVQHLLKGLVRHLPRSRRARPSPAAPLRARPRDNSTERRRSRPQSRGGRGPATQPPGVAPRGPRWRCAAGGRPQRAAGSEEEEPGAGRRRSRPGFLPVRPGFRSMDRRGAEPELEESRRQHMMSMEMELQSQLMNSGSQTRMSRPHGVGVGGSPS